MRLAQQVCNHVRLIELLEELELKLVLGRVWADTQTTVEVVALEVARPSSSTVVVVIPSISSD